MRTSQAFLRFLIVGSVCALMNLVLVYLLTDLAGLHYLLSVGIAFALTNYLGFWLNKYFSFRKVGSAALPEMYRYYLTMLASLLISLALMYVLVDVLGMWYVAANALVALLLLFFNFFGHRNFSFSERAWSR